MAKPNDDRTFEERYSSCFVDIGVKTTAGIILGTMFSSFFLRGNLARWPKYILGGLGFGMGYSNCENSLNEYLIALNPSPCPVK
ncbi:hypothetical protein NE865_03143 [Phthorimaea operculella]|nr:hypothetical protein NE865_03143 [Phthorimaea operculella]